MVHKTVFVLVKFNVTTENVEQFQVKLLHQIQCNNSKSFVKPFSSYLHLM